MNCPNCNENRESWFIYERDVCVFNAGNLLVLYENINGWYAPFCDDELDCLNCINFIKSLKISNCDKCPNMPRWFYRANSGICYYNSGGGCLEYADIDSIQCCACKTYANYLRNQ
jgi:hypothetical protein